MFAFVHIFSRLFCRLAALVEHVADGAVPGTSTHVVNQDDTCILLGDYHKQMKMM